MARGASGASAGFRDHFRREASRGSMARAPTLFFCGMPVTISAPSGHSSTASRAVTATPVFSYGISDSCSRLSVMMIASSPARLISSQISCSLTSGPWSRRHGRRGATARDGGRTVVSGLPGQGEAMLHCAAVGPRKGSSRPIQRVPAAADRNAAAADGRVETRQVIQFGQYHQRSENVDTTQADPGLRHVVTVTAWETFAIFPAAVPDQMFPQI